jgi:cell division protein FtsI (penicillin-binding protein 3)
VSETKVADHTIETFETKVLHEKICSDKTLEKVKKMLEGVVQRGTARNISNTIYQIAGKTGTTKKLVNNKYTNTYYTTFVGYFPADNPKYSCIVMIDNPKGFQLYGGDVAAPVFKEIADKIYARDLDLHTPLVKAEGINDGIFPYIKSGNYEDLRLICNEMSISNHLNTEEDEWVFTSTRDNSVLWNKKEIVRDIMPDVIGMTLRDALFILENLGLKVQFFGSGRVKEQSLIAGNKVEKGVNVNIRLE